jgi:hypothetical protein
MDIEEVMQLDGMQALDHIYEAVSELLNIRREAENRSWFERFSVDDNYEKAL